MMPMPLVFVSELVVCSAVDLPWKAAFPAAFHGRRTPARLSRTPSSWLAGCALCWSKPERFMIASVVTGRLSWPPAAKRLTRITPAWAPAGYACSSLGGSTHPKESVRPLSHALQTTVAFLPSRCHLFPSISARFAVFSAGWQQQCLLE